MLLIWAGAADQCAPMRGDGLSGYFLRREERGTACEACCNTNWSASDILQWPSLLNVCSELLPKHNLPRFFQSGNPDLLAANSASQPCHYVQGFSAKVPTGLNVEVTYSYKVERPAAGKNPRQIICCLELTGNVPTGVD